MWPERVLNSVPLAFDSDALPTSLRGPAVCVRACVRACVCVCECTVMFPVGNSTLKKS